MPRAKRSKTKRTQKSGSTIEFTPQDQLTDEVQEAFSGQQISTPQHSRFQAKYIFSVMLLVGLAVLLYINKPMYLAAVVNNTPIFRWDLNRELTNRFGKQILESMITEALINEEARKNNVVIDASEIKARQDELLASLGGGVTVEDILKYQGMTKSDFDNQIRMQLVIQRLVGKDIVITDKDVEQFIATNSGQFIATNPAELAKQAKQALFEDQIAGRAQAWFSAIKEKANVSRYVN